MYTFDQKRDKREEEQVQIMRKKEREEEEEVKRWTTRYAASLGCWTCAVYPTLLFVVNVFS